MNPSRKLLAVAAVAVPLVAGYLANASWLARTPGARPVLLSHRGVHQTFACPHLDRDTCTAACMTPPTHDYLENTLASMRAAFDAGADIVEIDVHPTTDGQFAVFHDWRLECRTNGSGMTRERSMTYLKTLDVGYGYTADGGRTFPFRGKGVGLMPTLVEVLDTFPDRRFLVNVKSNDPGEGERLAAALAVRPAAQRHHLMVYGGPKPMERFQAVLPEVRVLDRQRVRECLQGYLLVGWTGHVPQSCRDTVVGVPRDRARWLWGWPHRFVARMKDAGTEVFVLGARGDGGVTVDTVEALRALGPDFAGGIGTERIEVIGPAVAAATP